MAGFRKKQRIQLIIGGLVLLVAASALIGYGLRDGIEFFRAPTQVVEDQPAKDEVFRLGGLVEEGSLERGDGKTVRFRVTDGAEAIPVEFSGILPDLFREGQGMIASGNLIDGVFVASEVLAKHDENYMPKEVADALKEQGHYREGS